MRTFHLLRQGHRRRAVAAVMLTAMLTASCATRPQSSESDVADQGFISGDGSVRTWDAGHRDGPVVLTGADYAGQAIDTSQWRGDVIVVNTWYAGCAPCRQEAPDLVQIATDNPSGVRVLGINTTDDAGAAEAFQRTFEVPYPSLDDRSGSAIAVLSGTIPLQAVPSTVVLDQEGKVAARVIGMVEKSTVQALIDDVIAEGAS